MKKNSKTDINLSEYASKENAFTDNRASGGIDFYHINNSTYKDLYPIDVGHELHAAKEKEFDNRYPYYLLHYVVKGKGEIEINGKKRIYKANDIFVLPPDEPITYRISADRQWEYYWINFNGLTAKNTLDSIFGIGDEYYLKGNSSFRSLFVKAMTAKNAKYSQVYTVLSCMFEIFSKIAELNTPVATTNKSGLPSFGKIFDYINRNLYNKDLKADDVAKTFFVNPCYFSVLFKKNLNVSFKEYLNYERIKKASELLDDTDLLIKEVADAVGFSDALYFGKVFKKYRIVSPQEYRDRNK